MRKFMKHEVSVSKLYGDDVHDERTRRKLLPSFISFANVMSLNWKAICAATFFEMTAYSKATRECKKVQRNIQKLMNNQHHEEWHGELKKYLLLMLFFALKFCWHEHACVCVFNSNFTGSELINNKVMTLKLRKYFYRLVAPSASSTSLIFFSTFEDKLYSASLR